MKPPQYPLLVTTLIPNPSEELLRLGYILRGHDQNNFCWLPKLGLNNIWKEIPIKMRLLARPQ